MIEIYPQKMSLNHTSSLVQRQTNETRRKNKNIKISDCMEPNLNSMHQSKIIQNEDRSFKLNVI